MKHVQEIFKSFDVDFTIAPHENGVIVLFLFPYRPFEPFPQGHMFLDNYYIVSQAAHKKMREITDALKAAGCAAEKYRDEFLKPLAVRLGAATRCKNDLVYNEKYGSYFYIDAIKIANCEWQNISKKPTAPVPADCDACIRACPNGALSEAGFDRARCLRQFMDKRHVPSGEEKNLIGDRLMGCIECRAACPKNAHIKPRPIPAEVLAATKKGSVDMNKIKELVGDNLFKKSAAADAPANTQNGGRMKDIKLFVIDIDGTISLGKKLFEGSKTTLERIKASGASICLFTNNSSLGAEDYLKKLAGMGLDISRDELYTSALAAVGYIKKHHKNKRVYVLGTTSAKKDFAAAGINLVEENPDLVVLTLNPEMTYETLAKACLFIENGAEWISTHDDLACPAPGGFLPDAGAFIELIKLTTKKAPAEICGKPYSHAAAELMARFKLKPAQIAMIGDRLHADIKFALSHGFYGILVLTGGTSREELAASDIKPDLILDKISDLKI